MKAQRQHCMKLRDKAQIVLETQNVGDSKVLDYLPRRAEEPVWKCPKEGNEQHSAKLGGVRDS